MRTSRWIWGVWALVVVAFVLPYGLLHNVYAWYGSFLVWTLVGVGVIAVNALITKRFSGYRENDE